MLFMYTLVVVVDFLLTVAQPKRNLTPCVSFSRLVEVTCYGSQTSLYDMETAVPSVLKPDLMDV